MKKLKVLLLVIFTAVLASAFAACAPDETYTLSFETNGGTPVASVELKEGDIIPEAPVTEQANFTFAGWYSDNKTFREPFTLFGQKMPAGDLIAYAAWTPVSSVRVEYESMGGSKVASSVGVPGSAMFEPEVPQREGYRFGGWYADEAYEQPYTFTVFPETDITLYARWVNDPAYAYITYYGNGSVVARRFVEKGAVLSEPADLFGEDIAITGWHTDAAQENDYAFGAAVEYDLTLYTTYYTTGLAIEGGVVTGYRGEAVQVVVPDRLNGADITEVGTAAFRSQDITSVVLPSTVTKIGEAAFYDCDYLVTVNLGSSVTSIGAYAFYNAQRLIEYGDITSVVSIPDGLFLGCAKLAAAELGANVTSIGAQAFADCASLQSIVIPDGVSELTDGVFNDCASLQSVGLPASLRTLSDDVFEGCSSLKEMTLSADNTQFALRDGNLYEGTTLLRYLSGSKTETAFVVPSFAEKIAAGAFDGNATLTGVEIPGGVSIDCGALRGMRAVRELTIPSLEGETDGGYLAYFFGATERETSGIRSVYIPESLQHVTFTAPVMSLGEGAFYGATGLTGVSGLGDVTSVGAYAFAYTGLVTFEVPAGLTSLGEGVFLGCTSFEAYIAPEGAAGRYTVADGCLYRGTTLVSVPAAKETVVFSDTVTEIAAGAFAASSVKELTIPESVTTIGAGALNGMRALESLTVPFIGGDSENSYMAYLFGTYIRIGSDEDGLVINVNNRGNLPLTLTSITVTQPLTKIPDRAFAYLTNVTEIVLAEGSEISVYGDYSFFGTGITEWDFTGVTNLGASSFAQSGLTDVSLPGTLETSGEMAFALMQNLKTITLAEGITEISDMMFYGYSVLASTSSMAIYSAVDCELVIPASVKTIGTDAFLGAGRSYDTVNAVEERNPNFSLRFAEGSQLETIGDGAFAYVAATSVRIPAAVKLIGVQAFVLCNYLESVTIGSADETSALETIDEIAFAGCASLTSFTLYTDRVVTMNVQVDNSIPTRPVEWGAFEQSYDVVVYVPEALVEDYRAAAGWSLTADVIFAIDDEGGQNA